MKPIKLNKHIRISKCQSNEQRCSYCDIKIGEDKIGLSIYKPTYYMNIWIHINCIDNFLKDIKKFIKNHYKDIIIEELTEKR